MQLPVLLLGLGSVYPYILGSNWRVVAIEVNDLFPNS